MKKQLAESQETVIDIIQPQGQPPKDPLKPVFVHSIFASH